MLSWVPETQVKFSPSCSLSTRPLCDRESLGYGIEFGDVVVDATLRRSQPSARCGNGSITSHYSAAELDQLIAAANKVSATDSRAPALTILKRREA